MSSLRLWEVHYIDEIKAINSNLAVQQENIKTNADNSRIYFMALIILLTVLNIVLLLLIFFRTGEKKKTTRRVIEE